VPSITIISVLSPHRRKSHRSILRGQLGKNGFWLSSPRRPSGTAGKRTGRGCRQQAPSSAMWQNESVCPGDNRRLALSLPFIEALPKQGRQNRWRSSDWLIDSRSPADHFGFEEGGTRLADILPARKNTGQLQRQHRDRAPPPNEHAKRAVGEEGDGHAPADPGDRRCRDRVAAYIRRRGTASRAKSAPDRAPVSGSGWGQQVMVGRPAI